jgi:histidinol-phosphate aminotransferase
VERGVAHNARWLPWLAEEIQALGLDVTPSVANFILIHFPKKSGKSAKDADAFLLQRGLVLRRLEPYHLPDALRLTVGSEEANRLVVTALGEFLAREAARA